MDLNGRVHAGCIVAVVLAGMLVFQLAHEEQVEGLMSLCDVTEETGIAFIHTDGSSGRRYIIEAMSAGLALFDYNGDGYVDIYFLNGAPLLGTEVNVPPTNALYRNEGNWTFTDITKESGTGDTGFGLGVTVGDYDNDGDSDLYLNNYGPNVLYRNNGDETFTDVTAQADVGNGDLVGAGACFLDMDADGDGWRGLRSGRRHRRVRAERRGQELPVPERRRGQVPGDRHVYRRRVQPVWS